MAARHAFATLLIVVAGLAVLHAQGAKRTRTSTSTPPKTTTSAPAALTNQDILKMVQAGLGEAVVIATVRTSPARTFDLSPDGLIALKKGGVSDAIVAVMIDPKAPPASSPAPAPVPGVPSGPPADVRARVDSATASPEIPRDPGIYWDKGKDGAHNLVALEPTVFSQAKSGGFLTSAITYGIKKANWKAVTRGGAAVMHVTEPKPTFYFYFESKSSGLGSSGGFGGWLAGATSPNEFVLARMTSKSKERELVVGEFGMFGGTSGTRSKDTIALDIERLSGGVYKVTPSEALEAGEYCFFYAGGLNTLGPGATAGKLFDFGIYDATGR